MSTVDPAQAIVDDEQSGADALRDRLIALARAASIETSAHTADEAAGYGEWLPPGTPVYVAWVPGATAAHAVAVSRRVREAGLRPVPHVAARELVSEAEAERLIGSLRDEAGADEILLIAGDRATPAGPFADSAALLRTGLFARHGILRLGLAAYPEGNPKFDAAQWRDSFRDKAALAQDQGIALTLVTQFAFDGAAILAWLDALRTSGVGAPVRIGMAGPAKLSTLIKFGVRCGVGNSLRFLTSRPGHLANLLGAQGPDDVLAAIARADTALSVDGPHFFSFGGFAHTARWIARVRNGDFTLSGRDGLHVPAG